MNAVHDTFSPTLSPYWKRFVVGNGSLEMTGQTLRLANTDTAAARYTNAQIDDYMHVPRRAFPWRPPVTLTVRARFSHAGPPLQSGGHILCGTAGFGFWNDPFLMSEFRPPLPPRAIWFFYASPPSDMKLDLDTPGYGWKAATIDALRWPMFLLAPTTPVAVPLMGVPALYRRLWPIAQRALHIRETLVTATMTDWHTYTIYWGREVARFFVDGDLLMAARTSPIGPLGLVIWKDNQYMVVTPRGRFAYGQLSAPGTQYMELESVTVKPAPMVE